MEESQEQPQEPGTPSQDAESAAAQAPAAEAGRVAQLEAQLAQARREASDNWNRYLRERADMDNYRKRQDRLVADRILQQKKAMLHKMLDVMDDVDRALVYQETLDRQGLQQALRMVHWRMSEMLRGEGLSTVPTIGETFNPYMHEAIEAIESPDQPEGTIVEELRKGYTLSDETLRPARVKVSMGQKNAEG